MFTLRSLSSAIVIVLALAACAGPTASPSEGGSPAGETASENGDAHVVVTRDVAYESSSINELGLLDVYAPEVGREWPVVIMYHGGTWDVYKGYLAEYARRVAELGFVVFVPSWGHSGGDAYDALTVKKQIAADASQAACAAAFAAKHASEYGGDASSLVVFGHSYGGNVGSIVTLAPPPLADGCLATDMPQVGAFVSWEADWLLVSDFVDPWLVDDPTILEVITPWAHLPAPENLKIILLRGDSTEEGRSAEVATGPNGWLALRDPNGTLTAALEANGALAEDVIGPAASDAILIETLEAQGADVTLHIMPDSGHSHLSDAGWRVFLDAFRETGSA